VASASAELNPAVARASSNSAHPAPSRFPPRQSRTGVKTLAWQAGTPGDPDVAEPSLSLLQKTAQSLVDFVRIAGSRKLPGMTFSNRGKDLGDGALEALKLLFELGIHRPSLA